MHDPASDDGQHRFGYEWSGLSREEIAAGAQSTATFLNILLIPVLYVLVRTAIPARVAVK